MVRLSCIPGVIVLNCQLSEHNASASIGYNYSFEMSKMCNFFFFYSNMPYSVMPCLVMPVCGPVFAQVLYIGSFSPTGTGLKQQNKL